MRLPIVGHLLVGTFVFLSVAPAVSADGPWHGKHPWPWSRYEGSRRVDVIGPVGNRLPESYSRTYNRPSYLGGKIAAMLEPSSQEAMAFHNAEDRGLYDSNGIQGALSGQHCPPRRVDLHYFYPKPWEVLTTGPRRDRSPKPDEQAELIDRPRSDDSAESEQQAADSDSPSKFNSPDVAEAEELAKPADVIFELPPPSVKKE